MRCLAHLSTAVVLAGLLGACGTMKLPPRLTPAERASVEATRFDAVVGVAPYDIAHTRKDIRAVVRDTGLFTRVELVEDLDAPPDLLVKVHRLHGGTAIIPLLTIVTLGILPTFFEEAIGYELIFLTPERDRALSVGYRFEGWAGLGVLSSPLNLLPGWGHPTARPPERLGERFAVELAARADEIRALLREPE